MILVCSTPRDHPRMCGEHASSSWQPAGITGSSPHVRGARHHSRRRLADRGIIPACAGSTEWRNSSRLPYRDHPRMCGEHAVKSNVMRCAGGSSPHVRGARRFLCQSRQVKGIIPACAGSTRLHVRLIWLTWDHPRMCGEHEVTAGNSRTNVGSSPHVRGALAVRGGRCGR